ncbi:MAG: hypothetical protein GWO24_22035, partial [Akkermansiaceae bacterium]|nr:hypothetical protein [Akkermansiaceae bacterium]
ANRVLEVRLRDKTANSSGVGARITVRPRDAKRSQTAEITAGSGYLGQSEAARWFGIGAVPDDHPVEIQ